MSDTGTTSLLLMPTRVRAFVHAAGVRNRNALSVQRDGMVGERGPNGNPDLRGAQDSAPTRASKLRVGPSFLESLRRIPGAFGPHWVVAFEPTNYDWAIVSPGAPHIRSNGACRAGNTGLMRFHTLGTGEIARLPARAVLGGARRGVLSALVCRGSAALHHGLHLVAHMGEQCLPQRQCSCTGGQAVSPAQGRGLALAGCQRRRCDDHLLLGGSSCLHPAPRLRVRAGLRLFTRKPVDSASTAVMLQKLKDLGYDTSMLLPVQHTGCDYTAGVPVGAIHCAGTTCLAG